MVLVIVYRMMAASLLACGVNPDKSVIFRQAEVNLVLHCTRVVRQQASHTQVNSGARTH